VTSARPQDDSPVAAPPTAIADPPKKRNPNQVR